MRLAVALCVIVSGCAKPGRVPSAAVAAPKVVLFEAEPAAIAQGERAMLRWKATGAVRVKISPGVVAREAEGSATVQPRATTEYLLMAFGADGQSASAKVTVEVSGVTSR